MKNQNERIEKKLESIYRNIDTKSDEIKRLVAADCMDVVLIGQLCSQINTLLNQEEILKDVFEAEIFTDSIDPSLN